MGIIAPPPNQSPPSTPEQIAQNVQQRVTARINSLFQQMGATFAFCMSQVWQNQNVTPQQVFDAFGANGAELFRLANLLATTVNSAVPGTIADASLTPPLPYTINADGSVTVQEAGRGQ
ncbi:MAG TPA: hypothetical protein VHQ47_17675 [Phycisphaerae bacterium]|jgi:hypothetical protein|nr:hypothetical protein [Phycisphaerae bacterium]